MYTTNKYLFSRRNAHSGLREIHEARKLDEQNEMGPLVPAGRAQLEAGEKEAAGRLGIASKRLKLQ